MRVLFIVFILTFLIQFYPARTDKQYWRRTLISFVPLFLFMALRIDYGIDEDGYHDFYDGVQRASNIFAVNEHMEYGYAILNKLIPSYQLLIAISSFLTCLAYSFLIYKYVPKNYSWLAILLLFFCLPTTIFFMISGIRNGMTASLLVLSCYYLDKKKIVPYIIIGIIATSIHTSAMVMFVVCYLLSKEKPLTKKEITIWLAAMISAAFMSLSSLANTAMPVIELFLGRYVGQVEGMAEIADGRGIMASLAGIILAAGIIFFLKTSQQTYGNNSTTIEYNSMKYKFALFYAFSFTLGILGGRMGQYMIYFFIVSVTCMVAYWKQQIFKFGYLLAVVYLFRITLLNWLEVSSFYYTTYTSILGNL